MVANYVITAWSDPSNVALLRQLWIDGVPCNGMAARISKASGFKVTRNAVIGKVHRMGWHHEFPRTAPGPDRHESARITHRMAARAKQAKKPKRPAKRPVVIPCVPIIADVSNARPWQERQRGQCAFPLGERGAVMSCCAPTEETYCPAHRQAMGGFRKPWTGKDHARPKSRPHFSSDLSPSGSDNNSEAA